MKHAVSKVFRDGCVGPRYADVEDRFWSRDQSADRKAVGMHVSSSNSALVAKATEGRVLEEWVRSGSGSRLVEARA